MPPSLGRFGDARRQSAGMDLLARLVEVGQSGVSVRALGGSRSGEVRFGRFLRCDGVTPGEMIATATAHTKGCHVRFQGLRARASTRVGCSGCFL